MTNTYDPEDEKQFMEAADHLFATVTSQIQGKSVSRPMARDYVDGILVDTCSTSDLGYETAILDQVGAHPVARYRTASQAMKGHAWWCKHIRGQKTVISLGYPGLTEDEDIRIVRMK